MATSKGKQFEQRFKQDWQTSIPNSFLVRLPDQVSGYKGNADNICDFIAYANKKLFLLECKSHKGNTFPLQCFPQYKKLSQEDGKEGIVAGVILWFIEHDKVLFVPISTFTLLYKDNKKSFNINMLKDKTYPAIEIPSKKLRTFMQSDYKILLEI